jgi:hypothetical protein
MKYAYLEEILTSYILYSSQYWIRLTELSKSKELPEVLNCMCIVMSLIDYGQEV